jgi:heme-degrading monooxygenase HmoA
MVARVWHGWTREADADAYAEILRSKVFPEAATAVQGFRGAYLLRRVDGAEVEFEILTLFDSLDSVRGFAGDDYEVPVIEPEARRLLTHGDERAVHYEVAGAPF